MFYKVWFTKLSIFYKTELINSGFLLYFHTFLSQSMSFCHSCSGFTYCIVSNMSVRYETILLPRCNFELLDV